MPPARTRGSITLELIIAFAVLSLVLTSTILLTGGSDALSFEQENAERSIAEQLIGDARVSSSTDLASLTTIASTSIRDGIPYSASLLAESITPCLLELSDAATSTGGVGDGVSFSAWVADIDLMQALGEDCEYRPATSSWSQITQDASLPLFGTSVDVLGEYAYVGLSVPPYFAVVQSGKQIAFQNGFALPEAPNALDAAYVAGNPYVFAAMASSSNQFAVIDVSDPANPVPLASLTLAGVNPLGADPAAYGVVYNAGYAYVATRFITGPQPELHIFDVHDPAHPFERATANLETTVHGMTIRTRVVGAGVRTYLYAATTHDACELAIYDVTNPSQVSLAFSVDLPGSQDGDSIAIEGSRLFLGRASNTGGPELYVFDIHDSTKAAALIGTAEISSKDITAITPVGPLLFVGATNDGANNRMLEVWNASDASHLREVSALRIPGLVLSGLEYAQDRAYALDASALHIYGD